MKVSEKMYGLPGKCVACRQKIRIPEKNEIPEGTTDIHLRDHPELLREPARVATDEETEAASALAQAGPAPESGDDTTPNTELDLPQGDVSAKEAGAKRKPRSGASLALDRLPPLQVLCSLEHKFSRQLDTLELNEHEDEVLVAELEGHLARVRKLRRDLDDHLHQLLMEVAIELATTQEKIAQTKLSGRTGEISWAEYQENMHRLRHRRDRLERRQQNLRGWLATKNPYRAGGLLDLSVENIPEDGFAIALPNEPDDDVSLLAAHTAGLRDAFELRARARQRHDEVKRMTEAESGGDLDELTKESEEERQFARARVAFFTDRLEQLKRDYATDLETANAQLNAARDRLKVDEISRPDYDAIEREILRGKKDLARAQSVVTRALSANSAGDVPSARGTFLQRLGFVPERRRALDSVIAWASAALLVAAVFLPAIGTLSLAGAYFEFNTASGPLAWLFLAPITLALVSAVAALIPVRSLRGGFQILLGMAGFLAAVYLVHESRYSLDPMAARFRSGTEWFLRPGVMLLFLGIVGTFAAGAVALWPIRMHRVWLGAAAAAGLLAAGLIATDAFGAFRPSPRIDVFLGDSGPGSGAVRISNQGGRPVSLLARPTDAAGSYFFDIELQLGSASFAPAQGEGPLWEGAAPDAGPLYVIPAGGSQDIPFTLPPGEYRILLDSGALDTPLTRAFSIAPPPEPAPAPPAAALPQPQETPPTAPSPPGTAAAAEKAPPPALRQVADQAQTAPGEQRAPASDLEEVEPAEPTPPAGDVPEVELHGIMISAAEPPRFSFMLHFPDGAEQRVVQPLGRTLWGEWTIEEFNPDQRTVTLQREGRFLIIRRGTRVPLSIPAG